MMLNLRAEINFLRDLQFPIGSHTYFGDDFKLRNGAKMKH